MLVYQAEMSLAATYIRHGKLNIATQCVQTALEAALAIGRLDLAHEALDQLFLLRHPS
jgi:hypothetical protein